MSTDIPHAMPLIPQFDELQKSFLETPYLPVDKRLVLLKKLRTHIVELEQELVDAASKDFGYRTAFDTLVGDILPTV